jgi:alpha-D-xyloside xylohydrolase
LPYLYSTAWQVTSAGESYLRPLFSDFAADRRVWNTTDQFLFGRSILAAPILEAQYTQEQLIKEDAMSGWDKKTATGAGDYPSVDWSQPRQAAKYLPKGADWYDFYSHRRYRGGQTVTLTTTLDRVPMFVRAGSILPLGPEMQYVGEKDWSQLELRLYPGADGSFTLYEDEGDNYNYERGQFSTITFTWNDARRTLTIGQRQGQYPGMLQNRKFTLVMPDGKSLEVNYDGGEQEIAM